MEIIISKATKNDAEALVSIARITFQETYASSNSKEDIQRYLEENFNQEILTAELDNANSFYYLVKENHDVIGYLKVNISQAQSDLQEDNSLEIERIYVLASYHGKKVGQLLYEQAIKTANELHKTSIWLGVWERNPRAIKFYEKNGFKPFGTHLFKMGEDDQTDILMRKI